MKALRFVLLLAAGALSADEPPIPASAPVGEMVFVSCFKQTMEAPAFEAAAALKPDVFVWMGDNVYGDTEDMAVLRAKYQVAREHPAYAAIRATSRVIGTWDDHDYGANDAGKEYPMKKEAQQVFLDFLDVPEASPRRTQEGVYSVADFGPPGQMVRVILLDTRYFRDPVGSDGTILGEAQWQWLEKVLSGSTAKVNILVSSIQVLPSEHRWEKWANFPKERKRLLDLLAKPEMPPVLLISGDRHVAELSLDSQTCGYPLYEMTSSSLNLPLGKGDEPNRYRVSELFRPSNFGTVSVDWSRPVPVVTACVRDEAGRPQRAVSLTLER
ncbi:alkaline phosphatase [Haloferula helveola]|uniref:Alkaline phosphatase n=1 Tax=Haloferula helveola TaxID=490095 RepID=A0ABM7RG37_9BACT|nr:alkaline phosphatase [Haloferula helveola]